MVYSWEAKSLQELEGEEWGDPAYNSHVVRTCHSIRQKRLRDLSVEELRLAIGQGMGLKYLLPIALQRLSENPFAAGDYFPGDLLLNVLRVSPDVWQATPPLRAARAELVSITAQFWPAAQQMDDLWKETHLSDFQRLAVGLGL